MISLSEVLRGVKSIEIESRTVAVRAEWGRGMESVFNGYRFLVGEDEKFWKWRWYWLHNHVNVFDATEQYSYNG